MSKLLISFDQREVGERTIEIVASQTEYVFPQGPGLIQYDYENYHPTTDLAGICLDLGEILERDGRYHTGTVTAGTKIAPIWSGLSAADFEELPPGILGVPQLSSSVLTQEGVNSWSHRLLFFVAEFEQERLVRKLLKKLEQVPASNYPKLYGQVNKYFYMLIAKATAVDLDHLDSAETLGRFRAPIETCIY